MFEAQKMQSASKKLMLHGKHRGIMPLWLESAGSLQLQTVLTTSKQVHYCMRCNRVSLGIPGLSGSPACQ